ncbi:MAG TPA: helix-turn-helix transcriptional regulator [Brevundimonas sp.]
MVAGDFLWRSSHHVNMEQPDGPDWYLHEWFATAGLKQHDLVTKLDYPKNTANRLWHGLQPFRRDHIQAISELLNIRPHELLMHPEEAMRIRRLEAAVREVAKEEAVPVVKATAESKKPTGRAA